MNRLALIFRSLPPVLALRSAIAYVTKRLVGTDASISHRQTGEDAVIRSLIDETRQGICVDVGCHDPIRSSNPLSLYLHGWRGVNIDANPRLIERFKATRLRDTAVCAAIVGARSARPGLRLP